MTVKKSNTTTTLTHKNLVLERNRNGFLSIANDSGDIEVFLKQIFPWSRPGDFLSLRDKNDHEIFLVKSISDLSYDNQKLLQEELRSTQFVFHVNHIIDIEEEVELRRFIVETEQGKRILQTKLEDWPEVLDSGAILIEDLSGDLYRIDDWKTLPVADQKKLANYVN